ncbi:hypothetical protein RCG67_01845 [Kocuria sp. CPCC 205292]|uniref:hypothetical protein n=1 Tax=Kocuria cellulosilytica TaxID=3071451 RepID=UPI0034D4E1B5
MLFTVTCTKCGAKEPTFSLEGRFPRHCFSDAEEANEARYREWQALNTGSVSVVARPCAPQGTGRRR